MPRHVTDHDKAPLIEVLTLMFMVIAILACFVRSGTKLYMIKALKPDDILTVVATVFAIAQSITVMVSSGFGLGKHFDTLSNSKQDNFFKSQYAANLLFIATLFTAKLSGAMSLLTMAQRGQKMIIHGCEIVIGLWGFSALIVAAFECRVPHPWDYRDSTQCIDRTAFWTYFSIANILTDVAIVAIMVNNVRKIQTSWGKKALVMGVFGSRILITPAIAVQIYFSNKAFTNTDFSFGMWEATIIIQLVQMLAIFTVCIPNLKPFLDSLESGQIRIDDLRRQGKSSSNGYPDYKPGYAGYKSAQNSAVGSKNRVLESATDVMASRNSHRSNVHEMVDMPKSRGRGVALTTDERVGSSWDGQSHTSHSSQTILIQQSWKVDVENTPLPTAKTP